MNLACLPGQQDISVVHPHTSISVKGHREMCVKSHTLSLV